MTRVYVRSTLIRPFCRSRQPRGNGEAVEKTGGQEAEPGSEAGPLDIENPPLPWAPSFVLGAQQQRRGRLSSIWSVHKNNFMQGHSPRRVALLCSYLGES